MVENLDGIGSPFHLLTPIDAQMLSNAVTFGVGVDPFILRMKLMFSIDNGGKFISITLTRNILVLWKHERL
jgi:hypothetical protein